MTKPYFRDVVILKMRSQGHQGQEFLKTAQSNHPPHWKKLVICFIINGLEISVKEGDNFEQVFNISLPCTFLSMFQKFILKIKCWYIREVPKEAYLSEKRKYFFLSWRRHQLWIIQVKLRDDPTSSLWITLFLFKCTS